MSAEMEQAAEVSDTTKAAAIYAAGIQKAITILYLAHSYKCI
jgi:hypothetical protein